MRRLWLAGCLAGALVISVRVFSQNGCATLRNAPHGAGETAIWPQFRGPGGRGIGATGFPARFGPDTNQLWKIEVPPGHSSPCIWGDRLFLTGFEEGRLTTLAVRRRDGARLWARQLEPGPIERGAHLSNPATATPATDGQRVFVYFGAFGLAAYDFEGKEVWRKPLPIPVTQHGAGTSPVLAPQEVLLNCDQDVGGYLLAVDKRNGATVWKRDRSGFRRGFSTPLLWPEKNPELAIVPGTLRVVAYDLRDGRERWGILGFPNEMVSSPTLGEGLVFVGGWTPGAGSSHLPSFDELLAAGDRNGDGKLTREEVPPGPARQHFFYIDANKDGMIEREEWESIASIFRRSQNVLMAVRPNATMEAERVVWKQTRGLPYVPSPLYYEGRVYLIKNGGLASCFVAKDGQVCYLEERIGALGDYYASPVAGGGQVCFASQSGTVVVIRAGAKLDVLARNDLSEPIIATPAIADQVLYVRAERHLYAFGETARPVGGAVYRSAGL